MTFEEKRQLKNAKAKTYRNKERDRATYKRRRERLKKLRELAKTLSASEYHQMLRKM